MMCVQIARSRQEMRCPVWQFATPVLIDNHQIPAPSIPLPRDTTCARLPSVLFGP